MKSITPYALIIVLVLLFLAMSSREYEEDLREEARIEKRLFMEQQIQQEADSLGLEGQEWCDYVNNYPID